MAATEAPKAPEPAKTPAATAAPAAATKATPAVKKEDETKETKGKTEKAPAAKKGEKTSMAPERVVRGEVASVEIPAKTLTVKTMKGKEPMTVGVEVPDTAKITQGKAIKHLADLKVGERVYLRYDRQNDKLVAEQIRILKNVHKSATMMKKTEEPVKKTS